MDSLTSPIGSRGNIEAPTRAFNPFSGESDAPKRARLGLGVDPAFGEVAMPPIIGDLMTSSNAAINAGPVRLNVNLAAKCGRRTAGRRDKDDPTIQITTGDVVFAHTKPYFHPKLDGFLMRVGSRYMSVQLGVETEVRTMEMVNLLLHLAAAQPAIGTPPPTVDSAYTTWSYMGISTTNFTEAEYRAGSRFLAIDSIRDGGQVLNVWDRGLRAGQFLHLAFVALPLTDRVTYRPNRENVNETKTVEVSADTLASADLRAILPRYRVSIVAIVSDNAVVRPTSIVGKVRSPSGVLLTQHGRSVRVGRVRHRPDRQITIHDERRGCAAVDDVASMSERERWTNAPAHAQAELIEIIAI